MNVQPMKVRYEAMDCGYNNTHAVGRKLMDNASGCAQDSFGIPIGDYKQARKEPNYSILGKRLQLL
jgi:hypothetical protein